MTTSSDPTSLLLEPSRVTRIVKHPIEVFALSETSNKDVEKPKAFARWITAEYDRIVSFEGVEDLLLMDADRRGQLYEFATPDGLSRKDFIDITNGLPLGQILQDIRQIRDPSSTDPNQDMRSYVAQHLALEAGDVLLDAGCSTGRNFANVPDGVTCIGADIDIPSLMIAAEMWNEGSNCTTPVFTEANIESLPIRDQSITKAQSFVVLALVSIRIALREIKRVLQPNGKFVFTLEGTGYWQELWDATADAGGNRLGLLRWKAGRALQDMGVYWTENARTRRLAGFIPYDEASIRKLVEAAGFKIDDITVIRSYQGQPRLLGVTAINSV